MQWLNRSEHSAEQCYFCINQKKNCKITWANRKTMRYDSVDSVLDVVLRSEENPKAPCELSASSDEEAAQATFAMDVENDDVDIDLGLFVEPQLMAPSESPPSAVDTSTSYQPERIDLQRLGEPILITQRDFDNIAKEANLSERQKEIVGSRLSDHNIMASDFKITAGRKRRKTEQFDEMFRTDTESTITYCWNVKLLFLRLKHPHNPAEWRLFIDGSTESLKAVLLHNTNVHPSVPVAYAVKVKETYESMKKIRDLIQYDEYEWPVCADLKVVAIIMGLKPGFSKHQCFLCTWEGRAKEKHYDDNHIWPSRMQFTIGKERESQIRKELVPANKIILPPLHIKLGVVRNFTRALPRNGEAYACLVEILRKVGVSAAKVENGKINSIIAIF